MATGHGAANSGTGGARRFSKTERLLLNRRQELLAHLELQRQLAERLRREPSDELDAVSELSETELDLSVAEIRSTEVAVVEDALRKIVDGTYGRCEMCGLPIPPARLRAAPWATLCLGCQRQSEGTSGDGCDTVSWDQLDAGGMDEAAAGRFIRAYVESGG